MEPSRRTFLKAGVGAAGVGVPFLLGRRLGREEVRRQEPHVSVTRAANEARLRLASDGGRTLGGNSSQSKAGGDAPRPGSQSQSTAASRSSPRSGTSTSSASCPVDVERTAVSSDEVNAALDARMASRPFRYYRYRLDETLQTTAPETVRALLACDRTDWNDYTTDFYDCEEFAMTLRLDFVNQWGLNNVGVVYDESATPIPHVYNIVVYDDATFDLVEPQTDEVVAPGADDRHAFSDVAILL